MADISIGIFSVYLSDSKVVIKISDQHYGLSSEVLSELPYEAFTCK